MVSTLLCYRRRKIRLNGTYTVKNPPAQLNCRLDKTNGCLEYHNSCVRKHYLLFVEMYLQAIQI